MIFNTNLDNLVVCFSFNTWLAETCGVVETGRGCAWQYYMLAVETGEARIANARKGPSQAGAHATARAERWACAVGARVGYWDGAVTVREQRRACAVERAGRVDAEAVVLTWTSGALEFFLSRIKLKLIWFWSRGFWCSNLVYVRLALRALVSGFADADVAGVVLNEAWVKKWKFWLFILACAYSLFVFS
jgi:hypothetical protein